MNRSDQRGVCESGARRPDENEKAGSKAAGSHETALDAQSDRHPAMGCGNRCGDLRRHLLRLALRVGIIRGGVLPVRLRPCGKRQALEWKVGQAWLIA